MHSPAQLQAFAAEEELAGIQPGGNAGGLLPERKKDRRPVVPGPAGRICSVREASCTKENPGKESGEASVKAGRNRFLFFAIPFLNNTIMPRPREFRKAFPGQT